MKYDFEMETDESTSVGKIVAQIKENSDVLEFGPGNGRMTSYLMEEKKCRVSIVELDKELYDHVSQFSTDAFMAILMKMIGSNTLLVRRLIISFLRMCWNI